MTDQHENVPSETPPVTPQVPEPSSPPVTETVPPAPPAPEVVTAAPEPKKKGWKSWSLGKKALISLAALIVVIGAAGMCSGKEQADGNSSRDSSATHEGHGAAPGPETSTEPGIGVPVRDGKFEFVVSGITRSSTAGDPNNEFLQETAKGEFVNVHLTVTNIGNEPQSYFPSEQKLVIDGKQFAAADISWASEGNGNINPGLSIDTTVSFDVPPGSQPEAVVLHDSMFSNGVTVSLTK